MIKLNELSTSAPKNLDKDSTKLLTKELVKRIGELAEVMYAERKHALLVVFQAMDGSGKDSAVKNIFTDVTPTFIRTYGFNKPSAEEFSHDFLWRVHKQVPKKGMIQVFVRSHYEDVLVQRVHGWVDEKRVDLRLEAINSFEKLLEFDNNTRVLKFYFHISPEEQAVQLQERIDDPSKHWKHNDNDWEERKLWDNYQDAYENCFNKSDIAWHVVAGDQRWYRDYVVAKTIVEAMEAMSCEYPCLQTEVFNK